LLARYGERIPVLLIEGREYAAPLSAADVEQALARGLASLAAPKAASDSRSHAHSEHGSDGGNVGNESGSASNVSSESDGWGDQCERRDGPSA